MGTNTSYLDEAHKHHRCLHLAVSLTDRFHLPDHMARSPATTHESVKTQRGQQCAILFMD